MPTSPHSTPLPFEPTSIEVLQKRCQWLEGQPLQQLAQTLQIKLPETLQFEKGAIGQLIEKALGAQAGSLPMPDFPHLGIELKTIPVNAAYVPQESTYICTTQVDAKITQWQHSTVYKKTRHILWVPILTSPGQAIATRQIGTCLLWQPTPTQLATLQADWEELMEMVTLGHIDQINASYGEYLHIRPKAAHSKVLYHTSNLAGERIQANPKGFYLRTRFTREILNAHLVRNELEH